MSRRTKVLWISILAISLVGTAALAKGELGEMTIGAAGLKFESAVGDVEMVVKGPGGYLERVSFEGGAVGFFAVSGLVDGSYQWEISPVSALTASRDGFSAKGSRRAANQSGVFTIVNGSVADDRIPENVSKDQQILDDLIVDGSICAGQDCVNGESFGFDTLRLKENNLRIRAQDTSNSASFPTVDWQITFNDSSNGGANKFSIDDIDAGRTPFTIEHSAPSHSLYVDDGGRIGLGTSTPVVEVHIKDGDTPTLRLEQDGTSGFTPQTWDLAGNETNFFVRDATNGSKLPFKIRPNAPTNSLYVDTDGDIGLGTASPQTELHVLSAANADAIVGLGVSPSFASNADAFVFGYNGSFTTPQGFIGTRTGTTQISFAVENNTEMILDANGAQFTDSCIEFAAGTISCRAVAGSDLACTAGGCP